MELIDKQTAIDAICKMMKQYKFCPHCGAVMDAKE